MYSHFHLGTIPLQQRKFSPRRAVADGTYARQLDIDANHKKQMGMLLWHSENATAAQRAKIDRS